MTRPDKLAPLLVLLCLNATAARAAVVEVRIDVREPFAEGAAFGRSGPYERVEGRFRLEVDPDDAANARIADLALAPRNERGRVAFWSEFSLLRPLDPARGNRRILYCVNNRGNKLALGAFNDQAGNEPRTRADAGNGFLMRQGYTVLWCGWNGDVLPGNRRLRIGLPPALRDGVPLIGEVYAEITVDAPSRSEPFAWGNTFPYRAIRLANDHATLTRRARREAPAEEIPRDRWSFAREEDGRVVPDPRSLFVEEGFRPGWLYDLVYRGVGSRVTGLGFAAVRDVVSALRHDADAVAALGVRGLERAYVFGISQSGRFIRHFIHEGFNGDESQRPVFDGAFAHVAGGGRGLFNARFAQTTRHGSAHEDRLFPADVFPFTTASQEDPVTGARGSLLDRARARGHAPRLFLTLTSTEYWARAGSLIHTDVEGRRDIEPAPESRVYFFTGAQHGVSSSPARGIYENPRNTLDHRPLLRAVLVALDRWVSHGEEPPASRFPRLDDGTLVEGKALAGAFPPIRGVRVPPAPFAPYRLDPGPRWETEGIADNVPPVIGRAYRTLVPAVDADGNERAGIRLPEVAVPLGTYTGWNTRAAEHGAAGALARWAGAFLPFARDAAERDRTGDPRPSVHERYPTREHYLARIAEACLALEAERLLLPEDAVRILRRAAREKTE